MTIAGKDVEGRTRYRFELVRVLARDRDVEPLGLLDVALDRGGEVMREPSALDEARLLDAGSDGGAQVLRRFGEIAEEELRLPEPVRAIAPPALRSIALANHSAAST